MGSAVNGDTESTPSLTEVLYKLTPITREET